MKVFIEMTDAEYSSFLSYREGKRESEEALRELRSKLSHVCDLIFLGFDVKETQDGPVIVTTDGHSALEAIELAEKYRFMM